MDSFYVLSQTQSHVYIYWLTDINEIKGNIAIQSRSLAHNFMCFFAEGLVACGVEFNSLEAYFHD